jgi:drug/metabolite transporter (DMT)-like permease
MMSTALRATLALIFTMLSWGISPALVRAFALATGPADSIVIRMVFTAICALPIFYFTGIHIDRKDVGRLLFVSIIGMFGYFVGSIFGFAIVPAGIGSMVFATQPLLIALVAAAVGTERLTVPTVTGLIISFIGSIYLFSGEDSSSKATENLVIGGILIFASCIAFSLYVIYSKPLIQKYGSMKITAWSLVLCAPVALPFFSGSTVSTLQALDIKAIAALLFLSIAATVMAVITWNYAVGILKSSTVGATLYVVPVLAALAGWILLGENIGISTLIAGVIILAGVAFAEIGKSQLPSGKVLGFASVLFAVCVWGLVPVATRFLVADMDPKTVMVLRVIPAGIIGLMMAVYLGVERMPWQIWARIAAAAIIGNVGYQVLSIFGAQYIPASWIGMLFGLEPVFIALFAVMFAGDKLTASLIAGMFLAMAGTVALMLGNIMAPAADVGLLGIVLVTLGTMGWGIYTVLVRPVSARYGALPVACLTLGFSAFPVLLFATPELPQTIMNMNALQWLTTGFIVIFCTVLGTLAWNFALGHMSSSLAGMFLYIQPLVAIIGGIFLLDEKLSITLLIGGALIIAGVAVAQFGPRFSMLTRQPALLQN